MLGNAKAFGEDLLIKNTEDQKKPWPEVGFSDDYNPKNESVISASDQERLTELELAVAEAKVAYLEEKEKETSFFKELQKILGSKNAKEPTNSESFAQLKYQKALEKLEGFKKQLDEKKEQSNAQKIAEIIGDSEIGNLILELKNSKEALLLPLYAKIISLVGKNIFANSALSSWESLKNAPISDHPAVLSSNQKIKELSRYGVDTNIDNNGDMQKWTLRIVNEILKFCGVKI